MRYAVQRLAELLDPNAHFAASASFTLDPVTAVAEFLELAQAYHLSNGANPSASVMADAAARTRHVLTVERNLSTAYGQRVVDAVDALNDALNFSAAGAQKTSKKKWLDAKIGHAARHPVRALAAVLEDPASGYRQLLMDRVQHACRHPPVTDQEWRQFDDDLRFSASLALSDGRNGTQLSRAVASAVSAASDDAGAATAIVTALTAPTEQFLVAMRVVGVRRPRSVSAFGCVWISAGDPWSGVPIPAADAELSAFVTEKVDCAVVMAAVEARDTGHARTVGIEQVERLIDQYRARHRAYVFRIDPATLVFRVIDGTLTRDQSAPVLPEAKARLGRPEPRLEQSLRYAALASSERAPVIKILHSWIALETLARGTGVSLRPYPFVMKYVATLLALHGVRHSLTTAWQVASRAGRRGSRRPRWNEIEGWLGASQSRLLPDLNRWLDLVRADPAAAGVAAPGVLSPAASVLEAAAVLHEVMPDFPPFVTRTLRAWHYRLEVGSRLSNWCDEMERRAEAALGRMYFVRNSSVHTALTQTRASEQMAHAALNITDTVFEVLPRWLRQGDEPWEAFERIERRSKHVRKEWNHSRPPVLNADKLTTMGGDGLSR